MSPKEARIIFMGTPEFAVESLKALVENKYNVVAVVTVPDKPAGRGQKIKASAVKVYAESVNIPILQPEKLKDERFIAELQALKADMQIVVAFRMLPEVVWAMPPMKTFNLHASLLPNYRGAAPINWAIINGEKSSGVSTFFIEKDIDTGYIIDQVEVPITTNMNVGELYEELMHIGSGLVLKTVDGIVNNNITARQQDEAMAQRPAPKIFKQDCKVDWNKSAQEIHNLIRGLNPYPSAWSDLKHESKALSAKIYEVEIKETCEQKPGTIVYDKSSLKVATKDHWLEIKTLQLAGKKRMKTSDLLRGFSFDGYQFC